MFLTLDEFCVNSWFKDKPAHMCCMFHEYHSPPCEQRLKVFTAERLAPKMSRNFGTSQSKTTLVGIQEKMKQQVSARREQ
jgi:hypothetical protein